MAKMEKARFKDAPILPNVVFEPGVSPQNRTGNRHDPKVWFSNRLQNRNIQGPHG